MTTFKLNRDELNFVLGYLPAYKDIPEKQKNIYTRIFGMLATAPKAIAQSFQFTVDKNFDCKINCIKTIRNITGWGLKEAKDAFDENKVLSLKECKMGKAEMEAIIKANQPSTPVSSWGSPNPQMYVEWFTS